MVAKTKIVQLKKAHLDGVARVFRRCFPLEKTQAHGAWNPLGGPMTASRLEGRVWKKPFFDAKGGFVLLEKEKIVGFSLAAQNAGTDPEVGGLCALAVEKHLRRNGLGSELLKRAERFLSKRGVKRIHAGFAGSPLSILGGVPLNEEAYPFFLNRKYRTPGGLLQVMSQDAKRYRMESAMRARLRKLETQGIRIGLYEPSQRVLMDRFLKKNFEGWHPGIMGSLNNDRPRLLIVASRGRTILGYSGPFSVHASGTGTFNSVGVAKSTRGLGIGAAVFNLMCEEFRKRGAGLVSLTTEVTNPAQEIYARAGYRAQYVIDYQMKKEV